MMLAIGMATSLLVGIYGGILLSAKTLANAGITADDLRKLYERSEKK
jgi:hypothetical protein